MTFPSMFFSIESNLLCRPMYSSFLDPLSSGAMKMLVPLFLRMLCLGFLGLSTLILMGRASTVESSSSSYIYFWVLISLSLISSLSSSLVSLVSYRLYSTKVSPKMVTRLFLSFLSTLIEDISLDFLSIIFKFINLIATSSSSAYSSSSEESDSCSRLLPCFRSICSISTLKADI